MAITYKGLTLVIKYIMLWPGVQGTFSVSLCQFPRQIISFLLSNKAIVITEKNYIRYPPCYLRKLQCIHAAKFEIGRMSLDTQSRVITFITYHIDVAVLHKKWTIPAGF